MRIPLLVIFVYLLGFQFASSQTNIVITRSEADSVLLGQFDPTDYQSAVPIADPRVIVQELIDRISPDSLKSYLQVMSSFGNRNTGSDTVSQTFGMGAARRWAYHKMQQFSARNENRLLSSYVQFDQDICGMGQHRNVIGVLPGNGPDYQDVIIVEGHLDSRCADRCDSLCLANGVEDNGSGSALVLELARVMSRYTFNRTLVFMLTTGEEQGLHGANAFAEYCDQNEIPVRAVYNNDIIGGIICGETASPPGCPGLNDIDSMNVRIYSSGSFNSIHKSLARFTRLQYEEEVVPFLDFHHIINVMTPEDRAGRGGDHMPFRARRFPAIRFTAANEHGNGDPSTPGYHDRQHTVEDILGLDTNGDGQIDSFFVSFNYLARNAMINANAMVMASAGPESRIELDLSSIDGALVVELDDPDNFNSYRIAVREASNNYLDTLYETSQQVDTLYGLDPSTVYFVSACLVDSNGIESFFSNERFRAFTTDIAPFVKPDNGIKLLQNRPNPFDVATTITVILERPISYREADIRVYKENGQELVRLPIDLKTGVNEVMYRFEHHRYQPGYYSYALWIDGKKIDAKPMIYAY